MPTFTFSTRQSNSITIDVSEEKREGSGSSHFRFDVVGDAAGDVVSAVETIRNTVAVVLSGEPRVDSNAVEWSGQSSLNSTQLMSTIILNLEPLGIVPDEKKRQSKFDYLFSKLGHGAK